MTREHVYKIQEAFAGKGVSICACSGRSSYQTTRWIALAILFTIPAFLTLIGLPVRDPQWQQRQR